MEDERETAGLEARWDSGIGELVFDGGFTRQLREYRDAESRFGSVRDRHANRAWDLETRYEDTYGGSRVAASWSGGYAFRHDVLDSTALAGSGGTQYAADDIVRIRHSLFARGELQLFPYEESDATRLGIFPALRWDGWSAETVSEVDASEGSRPSWTLGVVSALDPQRRVVLKSSVGSSYRVPSFDDLFWPGSAFAVGNPNLEPEEALSVDGGVILSPIPALHIEASAFYRRVRNLIHWTPGPNGQWRPVNIGRTRFSGIESGVRALIDVPALSSYLEASANGSYLRAEDRTEGSASFGETIPGKPRWQASAIVSMTHLAGHSLRAELRSVGRRYITAANTKWFEPYAVLDLAATVAVGAGFEMRLIGENLFDVSYVDLREYPVPGREVRAEVRYAF
jgi:vitamin B12 transporter